VTVGEVGPGKEDLRPMEGGAVFFNYTITSPELANIILEESDAGPLKMMWGETMMCLPQVNHALRQVHPCFFFPDQTGCVATMSPLFPHRMSLKPPMVGGWITPQCRHALLAAIHQE
jgi:hypothetical protein